MRVTLEFDDVPASQNRQLRMHWSARRKANETLAWLLLGAASEWARAEDIDGRLFDGNPPPAAVAITMWRSKVQDPDNAVASCKGMIDRLVRMGALRDDTREWLTDLTVTEEVGPKKTRIELDYGDTRWNENTTPTAEVPPTE